MVKSLEELNEQAEQLFNKEDKKGLKELAKEYALDEYLVDMYIQGELPMLCPDVATLAVGKLNKEVSQTKNLMELAQGIAEYMEQQVQENEELAKGVIEKPMDKLIKNIYEEAKKRKKGNCTYIPPFEVFQMAKAYYLEDEA